MGFEPLQQFLRPGFDLPFPGGKTYYVPPPSAKDGLWLQAIMDTGETILLSGGVTKSNQEFLDDEQEKTAYQISLGTAHDEMLADGVPYPFLTHAGMTALLYWTRGHVLAETYWKRLGDGQGKAETASSPTSSGTSPEDPSTPTPA